MSELAASGATKSTQLSAAAPLESFDALQREHGALRQWFSTTEEGAERDGAAERVREFLRRAAATGATLTEPGERKAAQAILNYWRAELVGLPQPRPGDFKPVRLAEPSVAGQVAGAANAADAQPAPESRDLIRLAATARLWRDSGLKGFLLSGDALDHAAKFRGVDDDIDKLVQASREALRKIRRAKRRWAGGGVAAVLLFWFGLVYLRDGGIAIIKTPPGAYSASVSSNLLRLLGLFQLLLPPYDLSGDDVVYKGVKVPGLNLSTPNFSSAQFKSVDFQGADLQGASFSNTDITETSNFRQAKLWLAQFRKARIEETSFARAGLYRAIFDQACLSDVDFTGADLQFASFWGVKFVEKFPFDRNFKDSPWWLAEGWNSRQIAALSTAKQDGLIAALSNAKQEDGSGASKEFVDDLESIRAELKIEAAGSSYRAVLANQLAWTLATWGMVFPANAPSPSLSLEQTCSRATESTVPEKAVDAAEQAVCIVHSLKKSEPTEDLTAWLASLQDTRAYVLLQSGRSTEAAEIYRNNVMPSLTEGGTLFRAAVAYQAIGDGEALNLLKRSQNEEYVPTHEMHTLRGYINGGFQKAVYEQIDRFRASIPPPLRCR